MARKTKTAVPKTKGVVPRKRLYVYFAAEGLVSFAGRCEIPGCTRPYAWNLSKTYDPDSQYFDDPGVNVCEDHLRSETDRLIRDAG